MARQCQQCGAENTGLPIFCRTCGARLGESAYTPDKAKKRRKRGAGGVWLLLLVLVGAAYAGYHYYWLPAMSPAPGTTISIGDQLAAITDQALEPLSENPRASELLANVTEVEEMLSKKSNAKFKTAGLDLCRNLRLTLNARGQCETAAAAIDAGTLHGLRAGRKGTGAESRKDFALMAQQNAWVQQATAMRPRLQAALAAVRQAESAQ